MISSLVCLKSVTGVYALAVQHHKPIHPALPARTEPSPHLKAMAGVLQRFLAIPVRRMDWSETDVRSTTERYLLFVQLPLWVLPGFIDWWWHRRTDIENTAGLPESLIHSAQMTQVGVPILMGLLFELNPLLLTIMAGAVAVHTATAVWDVRLAIHQREVKTGEQHTHSFMEVLPFMGLAFACCLHGDATRRLLTARTQPGDWQLKLKNPRMPVPYLATILGLIGVFVALPYANEAWRCIRQINKPRRNTGFYKDASETVRNC